MKVTTSDGSPLRALPLYPIHVERDLLSRQTWYGAKYGIGNVRDQHYIHLAEQNVEHTCQRMGECSQILGFDAGEVDEADTPVAVGLLTEQTTAAVYGYLVASCSQPGREFAEKCFRTAVGMGYSPRTKKSDSQWPIPPNNV